MRFRKLELEDQPWFPETVKEGMTDYLRFLFSAFKLYEPVIPLLIKVLNETNDKQIVDLCSGSGGAVENIREELLKYTKKVRFILTDVYPKISAYKYLSEKTNGSITFSAKPIDATNVPKDISGFRTLFSGIHHFSSHEVKLIIEDVKRADEGIAIFDGGDKNIVMILVIILFHPLTILLLTPLFQPFRWSRLLFTYIIPLIPIGAVWDGIISIINLYEPSELLIIAQNSTGPNYKWEAGKVKNRFGMKISYLIGLPYSNVSSI